MSSYSCSVCNKTSKTKGTIQSHINKETCYKAVLVCSINKLKCEVCSKECETEKLMNLHKKNCVKKRVQLINEDVDGELKKQNSEMVKMISMMMVKISKLEDDMEQLKKQNITLKKESSGVRDVNEDEKEHCIFEYNSGENVTTRKRLCELYGLNEGCCREQRVQVELNGDEKMGYMTVSRIKVDDVNYVFNKDEKSKNEKLASNLKLFNMINCENIASKYIIESGVYCCEKHVKNFK